MPRIARAVLLLASFASASALAGKQLIIDVEAENRPKTRAGAKAPAPPPAPELQLALSDNETARNLAPGIIEQLTALGYVLAPEVDYGRPGVKKPVKKPGPKDPPLPPDPKIALRFEIVRMGGSCFVTAKASEFKTQDISFHRYETKDDSLSCTDQLKLAIADFTKNRPPDKAPPGADAGIADASEAAALVEKHPKLVLAPTLINTEEPVPLGAPEPADAGAAAAAPAPAPEPPKKKGCGCSSPGEALALAAVAGLLAVAVRRRPRAT